MTTAAAGHSSTSEMVLEGLCAFLGCLWSLGNTGSHFRCRELQEGSGDTGAMRGPSALSDPGGGTPPKP